MVLGENSMNQRNISKFIVLVLISILILIIFQVSFNVQSMENDLTTYENVNLNVYEMDYLLKEQNELATNSIPYRLNSLHYTIAEYSRGQKIYVQNSRNDFKSYYLNGKYTSNIDVINFVSAVDKVASKARLFINITGIFIVIAIVVFLRLRKKLTTIELIVPIKVLGYIFLVIGVVIITNLYNDYVSAIIEADHRFNILYEVNINFN